MDKINVEGFNNLKRDFSTGAIINTDRSEYEKFLKLKNIKEFEKEKLDTAISDISVLKSELSEIKSLIQLLVKNNEGI